MISGDKVVISDLINERKHALVTVMSDDDPDFGILFIGENIKRDGVKFVRIYLVRKNGAGIRMERELQVYKFVDSESMVSFIDNMPGMSRLGMLLVLSGQASTFKSRKERPENIE